MVMMSTMTVAYLAVMTAVTAAVSAVVTMVMVAAWAAVTAVMDAGSAVTFSSMAIVAVTAVMVPCWRRRPRLLGHGRR